MNLKLIVMGDGGVGKSAITCRYTQGVFQEKYDPTIEDKYTKDIEMKGKALQLEILDTAGQEEYSALRETFMHTGDGFVLVYSITDDSTFEGLRKIREEILGVHPNPNVPMILVGNKMDLEDERAITKDEAGAMAREFGGIDNVEVSAFKNKGVDEMFDQIVKTIFTKNPNAGTNSSAQSKGVLGAGAAAPETAKKAEPKKKGCTIL